LPPRERRGNHENSIQTEYFLLQLKLGYGEFLICGGISLKGLGDGC